MKKTLQAGKLNRVKTTRNVIFMLILAGKVGCVNMVECRVCHCLCDPGDIVGGRCDDCRAAEERRSRKLDEYIELRKRYLKEQADGQLVLVQ